MRLKYTETPLVSKIEVTDRRFGYSDAVFRAANRPPQARLRLVCNSCRQRDVCMQIHGAQVVVIGYRGAFGIYE